MPKAKKRLIQQGDVLVFSGVAIPENAKPMKIVNGSYVLAEGEVTGHSHTIEADPTKVEGFESDGAFYLKVKAAQVKVTHQEHKPITLKKDSYQVRIVKEIDPFSEEVHKVRD